MFNKISISYSVPALLPISSQTTKSALATLFLTVSAYSLNSPMLRLDSIKNFGTLTNSALQSSTSAFAQMAFIYSCINFIDQAVLPLPQFDECMYKLFPCCTQLVISFTYFTRRD